MAHDRRRFGDFTVDGSRARLSRGTTEIALRPKSFALLQYLVANPGRVLTKDELLGALWPRVVVTEDSLTRCISEVRAALGDGAQTLIKTINKRGYLFAAAVTACDEDVPATRPEAIPADAPAPAPRRRRSRLPWFALGAAAVLSICVAAWMGPSTVPARLSLVVLPFANLSGDPAQEYLADVITNDLTIALSRLRGAMVIAPGSAYTLKGATADLPHLGSQLGVRYAVQGTVLGTEGRLRISARLVDTRNSAPVWYDQFDAPRADLLQVQDEIVLRLSNALDAGLVQAEGQRLARAALLPDAEDLAMKCEAAWFRLGPQMEMADRAPCEEALRLDPRNVRALVRLAIYHANRVSRVQSPDKAADVARASELVARAMDIDPVYYATHCAKSVVLESERRVKAAIAAAERCLALNPSYAGAYRLLATGYFFLAQPERTLEFVDRGIRVSPRDPNMSAFLNFKGWAYFQMRQDEEALVWLRRAAAAGPESPPVHAALASILALTGRDEEARASLAHYLALKSTRARTIAQWDHVPDENEAFRRFDARFKDGLRRAGLPQQ